MEPERLMNEDSKNEQINTDHSVVDTEGTQEVEAQEELEPPTTELEESGTNASPSVEQHLPEDAETDVEENPERVVEESGEEVIPSKISEEEQTLVVEEKPVADEVATTDEAPSSDETSDTATDTGMSDAMTLESL